MKIPLGCKTGNDASSRDNIVVPGNCQMQVYGIPIYTNISHPFKKDPPYITHTPPKEYTNYKLRNPVGSYVTEFTIPAGWNEKSVILHYRGVKSAFYVWLYGRKAGYSQGSITPAEFNLTSCLTDGKNRS